ncbi:MAG: hypothetical protein EOO06_15060 [Chitinophagaceae bacterium]|nr:MAG: hypothetical protein EOO06_15060 [Chitinophagaceae bacterium]
MNKLSPQSSFLKEAKTLLFLIGFVLLLYLPLSSFLFAIKNDAFVYNFPNKYFFSEALRHGYIPYWNPYLNYGFPLFADPGFAWWHPITWIFGLIGYSPFTFTIELLTYLIIAAFGMYRLGRQFAINRRTAFVMGIMFAGSGFFIGNMQHINFLTCAAFLPWMVGAWWKLQHEPTIKNVLVTVLATYLLCTAGHPAIPIGSLYFMMSLAVGYLVLNWKEVNKTSFFFYNFLYIALTAIACLPVILSYAQLMPYYTRSEAVSHLSTSNLGFTIPSYISFLSPVTTIKGESYFLTDVSMRNGYFSLFGFLALVSIIVSKINKTQKILLGAAAVMLVLSLGGWIKQLLYENLPLLSFIRTNGEFRVFGLFSFIVCVGFLLHQLMTTQKENGMIRKLATYCALLSGLCVAIFSVVVFASEKTERQIPGLSPDGIKATIAEINFPQALLVASLITLFIACIYIILLKRRQNHLLHYFILSDLVLNAWLLLPVTGVGQKSVQSIAELINFAPKAFPVPDLQYAERSNPFSEEDKLRAGDWHWYDKQIVHEQIEYPSLLKGAEAFYAKPPDSLHKKPFLFLKNREGTLSQVKFSPNKVEVIVVLHQPDKLILKQNLYPGWRIEVDGHPVPVTGEGPFLSTSLQTGAHKVNFHFSPEW